MKKIFSLFLIILCISCNNSTKKEKSFIELRTESLASGIRVDTIFGSLCFGQNRNKVYESLGMVAYLPNEKYFFDIKGLENKGFSVHPKFYNDSVFDIFFLHLNSDETTNKLAINVFTLKYGDPSIVEQKDKKTYYSWFKGNMQIRITDTQKDYSDMLSIDYRNMLINEYDMDNVIQQGDFFYTKEYYKNHVNTDSF